MKKAKSNGHDIKIMLFFVIVAEIRDKSNTFNVIIPFGFI